MAKSNVSFDNMSMDELRAHIDDALNVYASRTDDAKRELEKQMAELQAKAKQLGLNLTAAGVTSKPTRQRAPARPKYRDPKEPNQTWTGKGKKPKWVEERIASGTALESMLIPESEREVPEAAD